MLSDLNTKIHNYLAFILSLKNQAMNDKIKIDGMYNQISSTNINSKCSPKENFLEEYRPTSIEGNRE